MKLEIDTSGLSARMGLTAKNLKYATANAINATAKQVQEQARQNVRARFTLRKFDFILKQAAIIKPFASVNSLYAEVAVGQKDRLLLSDFEKGATRRPFVGARVAVPITGSPARPSFSSEVPSALRMQALSLAPALTSEQKRERRAMKGGNAKETRAMRKAFTSAAGQGQVWKGKQRTFMIPGLGVIQRTGPGKKDTVLLYKFVPHPVLKPRLGFVAMAKQNGQALLKANMEQAIKDELARKG